MEKEILWFCCFRRAEPERMISGWTASSRDSSKTEEGKAPRGYGQIRSELRMSSKLKLSRIFCPCRAKIRPAFVSPLPKTIISQANVLPDIILSLLRRKMSAVSLLLPEGFRRDERLRRVYRPRPLACGRWMSHALSAGDGPCRGHSVLPFTGVTICLQCAFMKELY